ALPREPRLFPCALLAHQEREEQREHEAEEQRDRSPWLVRVVGELVDGPRTRRPWDVSGSTRSLRVDRSEEPFEVARSAQLGMPLQEADAGVTVAERREVAHRPALLAIAGVPEEP